MIILVWSIFSSIALSGITIRVLTEKNRYSGLISRYLTMGQPTYYSVVISRYSALISKILISAIWLS